MNKSAKIIYPVLALLILAAPISASADNQSPLWGHISSLPIISSISDVSSDQPIYDILTSAINNFTASFDFKIIEQKETEEKTPNFTIKDKKKIAVTAYSSTPDQTDNSPFITANGSFVREGVVAANFLKFGTKVRFPDVYGDNIFIVADRMAEQNNHKIDVWMESRAEALQFGVKKLNIEILN